jgi:hypothetical protein
MHYVRGCWIPTFSAWQKVFHNLARKAAAVYGPVVSDFLRILPLYYIDRAVTFSALVLMSIWKNYIIIPNQCLRTARLRTARLRTALKACHLLSLTPTTRADSYGLLLLLASPISC